MTSGYAVRSSGVVSAINKPSGLLSMSAIPAKIDASVGATEVPSDWAILATFKPKRFAVGKSTMPINPVVVVLINAEHYGV